MRTLESIVENHNAAEALRKQGKPIWTHTVRIGDLFPKDYDADAASLEQKQEIGKKLSVRIRTSSWCKADIANWDEDEYRSEVAMLAEEFDDVQDAQHFENLLEAMYDLADADRTWIDSTR